MKTILIRKRGLSVLLGMLAALPCVVAAQTNPASVTGIYRSNQGALYYLRFVGDAGHGRLFWFGEAANGAFSNVMAADLHAFAGSNVFSADNGRWWDVPKGRTQGVSTPGNPQTLLNLLFEGNLIRKAVGSGIGFGDASWTRMATQPTRASLHVHAGFAGPGATGVWLGNDGGVYFVRQSGSDLVWFGQSCSGAAMPDFANVFVGHLAGNRASGQWADVPYGHTQGTGNLGLRVDPDRITRLSVSGGFGGSSWLRPAAVINATVSSLQVTLVTGGDDLRGGAVAYGTIALRDGRSLPRVNLNAGRKWPEGSVHSASLTLPAGTRLRDLGTFTLTHDGAARNVGETYDNWNVDALQIRAITSNGQVCLASLRGAPFARLTGERTFERTSIALP